MCHPLRKKISGCLKLIDRRNYPDSFFQLTLICLSFEQMPTISDQEKGENGHGDNILNTICRYHHFHYPSLIIVDQHMAPPGSSLKDFWNPEFSVNLLIKSWWLFLKLILYWSEKLLAKDFFTGKNHRKVSGLGCWYVSWSTSFFFANNLLDKHYLFIKTVLNVLISDWKIKGSIFLCTNFTSSQWNPHCPLFFSPTGDFPRQIVCLFGIFYSLVMNLHVSPL